MDLVEVEDLPAPSAAEIFEDVQEMIQEAWDTGICNQHIWIEAQPIEPKKIRLMKLGSDTLKVFQSFQKNREPSFLERLRQAMRERYG